MLMLQAVGKISGSKLRGIASVVVLNFSSNKNQPPRPKNSLDLPEKQPVYVHKVNYNYEQNKKYSEELKEVLGTNKTEEDVELNIKSNVSKPVARRERRVYASRRVDDNIEKYSAWRSFDREILKLEHHSLPVVCKIPLAPKYLIKAFGKGAQAYRNKHATLEYDFEDANLDVFLLYDYRATTQSWGANVEGFNYDDQMQIPPRKRLQKWPTPEEFWQSEEEVYFRVNSSEYADFAKFKKFVITKVNEVRDGFVDDYKERMIKKFGKPETFDDYNAPYNMVCEPAIYKYNRSFFLQPGEKHETVTRYHTPPTAAQKLDDKHKITKASSESAPPTPTNVNQASGESQQRS